MTFFDTATCRARAHRQSNALCNFLNEEQANQLRVSTEITKLAGAVL
jgi:hypothetical protein